MNLGLQLTIVEMIDSSAHYENVVYIFLLWKRQLHWCSLLHQEPDTEFWPNEHISD